MGHAEWMEKMMPGIDDPRWLSREDRKRIVGMMSHPWNGRYLVDHAELCDELFAAGQEREAAKDAMIARLREAYLVAIATGRGAGHRLQEGDLG